MLMGSAFSRSLLPLLAAGLVAAPPAVDGLGLALRCATLDIDLDAARLDGVPR